MKPPTRKLIGRGEESHTREYLFQILAQTMGCRERSRFRVQEHQEHETRSKTRVFEKKERGEEEIPARGPCGPQSPSGRDQGVGRATWPPGPGVDPPCQPQVPLAHILPGKL